MPYHHYLLYKPYGVVSQFSGEGPTLKEIFPFPRDVYPVGRLDKDSEGLLLLTNDRRVQHRLTNPRFGHVKTYWVQVEGLFTEKDVDGLERGVPISLPDKSEYITQPCKVRILGHDVNLPERHPPIRYRKNVPDTWIEIQLKEGKNRQVRRMTAAIGFPTLRLVRVAIGALNIHGMNPGEVRPIGPLELELCYRC